MQRGKHERNVGPAIAARRDTGAQKIAAVEAIVKKLSKQPDSIRASISTQSVALSAGVSRAFIYNHPDLHAQIVAISKVATRRSTIDDRSASVLIKALQKKVASLESQILKMTKERTRLLEENAAWMAERESLWGRIAKLTEGK
jgi:hypothetical protein